MTEEQQPIDGFVPILPMPVETRVAWNAETWQGSPVVTLTFSTPVGIATYYFPPEACRAMGAGLTGAADQAEAIAAGGPAHGIIVPDVDIAKVLRSMKNGGEKA